jgi:hypothetical protein
VKVVKATITALATVMVAFTGSTEHPVGGRLCEMLAGGTEESDTGVGVHAGLLSGGWLPSPSQAKRSKPPIGVVLDPLE